MWSARLKILLVNNLYHPHLVGGAERSVQFLAEILANRNHDIHIATIADRRFDSEVNGAKVHYLPSRNFYWFYKGGSRILKPFWHALDVYNPFAEGDFRRLLGEICPDVVHTNNLSGFSVSPWKACQSTGTPIVHTLRDYYLLCSKSSMFRNGQNCLVRCASCRSLSKPRVQMTRLVDCVVGNSQRILDIHIKYGVFANTPIKQVVYNAYPPPTASFLPKDDMSPLTIGYLGQVAPHKGVRELVQAVASIPQGTLLIGGEGSPEFIDQLAQAAPPGRITMLGRTKQDDFFPRIDVLAVPSLWEEPMPRVALEALSWGIPVISSDQGGTSEILEEGVTGWVLECHDISERIAQCLQTLTRPGLAAMAPACRESARRFAPDFVASRYEEIYSSAVSAKRSSAPSTSERLRAG